MGPKRSTGAEAGKAGGAGSRAQGQQPGLDSPPDLSLVACFRVFPSQSNASSLISWLLVPAPCSGCRCGVSIPRHGPSVQNGRGEGWLQGRETSILSLEGAPRAPSSIVSGGKSQWQGQTRETSPPSLSGAAEERISCCREPAQPATAPAHPGTATQGQQTAQTALLVPSSHSELLSPDTAPQEGSCSLRAAQGAAVPCLHPSVRRLNRATLGASHLPLTLLRDSLQGRDKLVTQAEDCGSLIQRALNLQRGQPGFKKLLSAR